MKHYSHLDKISIIFGVLLSVIGFSLICLKLPKAEIITLLGVIAFSIPVIKNGIT